MKERTFISRDNRVEVVFVECGPDRTWGLDEHCQKFADLMASGGWFEDDTAVRLTIELRNGASGTPVMLVPGP